MKNNFWIATCLLLLSHAASADSLTFVAIGDQGTGTPAQYRVAEAIASVCASNDCAFAISTGDNMYDHGVNSVDDDAFLKQFEEPYSNLDFPFYMTLGNHDNTRFRMGDGMGNYRGDYQVEYHYKPNRVSDKWQMPSRYYAFHQPDDSDTLATFLALDSGPLSIAGIDLNWNYWSHYYGKQQGDWITETLNASDAPWKIAFGHHAYLSNAKHQNAGSFNGIKGRGRDWKALVDERLCKKIDVLISGHDHNLQWLAPVKSCGKTFFIVTGAGARTNPITNPDKNTFYFQQGDVLGFFLITLTETSFTGQVWVVDGKTGEYSLAYTKTVEKDEDADGENNEDL